ncbi:MAG: M23 family metallopeptidase [Candidatus Binatia bacterium]
MPTRSHRDRAHSARYTVSLFLTALAIAVLASCRGGHEYPPGDSSTLGADLTRLRLELMIPVEGVHPADLPDTFNEMRGSRRHDALDIPAPRGTPVLSAAEGRLLKLFASTRGGLMVYAADVTERFILIYAHLDRYADGLNEGMRLRRGQMIGYVGTSGNAPPDAPHLHFEIAHSEDIRRWWQGTPVNPRPLLIPEGW